MCYFGMAPIYQQHDFEKPKGFGLAGSGAYICGLLHTPWLLVHRHVVTPHASSTHPWLLHVSLWNYEFAVAETRLLCEGSHVFAELDAWYIGAGG